MKKEKLVLYIVIILRLDIVYIVLKLLYFFINLSKAYFKVVYKVILYLYLEVKLLIYSNILLWNN